MLHLTLGYQDKETHILHRLVKDMTPALACAMT